MPKQTNQEIQEGIIEPQVHVEEEEAKEIPKVVEICEVEQTEDGVLIPKENLVENEFIIELEEYQKLPKKGDAWYQFQIVSLDSGEKMGRIQFNTQVSEHTQVYYGNIGYRVFNKFQGKKLAQRGVETLMPFIRNFASSLEVLYLTTDPENKASIKTALNLGYKFLKTIPIPITHELAKESTANSIFTMKNE